MTDAERPVVLTNPEWWRKQRKADGALIYVKIAGAMPFNGAVTATWHIGSPDGPVGMEVTWKSLAIARQILTNREYHRADTLGPGVVPV